MPQHWVKRPFLLIMAITGHLLAFLWLGILEGAWKCDLDMWREAGISGNIYYVFHYLLDFPPYVFREFLGVFTLVE